MKHFEHVDLRQHFREFYRIFLPLLVLFSAIAVFAWIKLGPDDSTAEEIEWVDKSGKALVGLLNPAIENANAEMLGLTEEDFQARLDQGQTVAEIADELGIQLTFFDPAFAVLSPIEMVKAPVALHFDPPMGSEHSALTYNAQPFLTTRHLGDDINGIGGQNSDLGDPVYAVADGVVIYTGWPSDGWGNVVIILHTLPNGKLIESFYGHLDEINTLVGDRVRRGKKIGRVGNANGRYLAHLHFELRTSPTLDCGAGYADSALDRLSGEFSLIKWRGRDDDRLSGPPRGAPREPAASVSQ